ncbi:MAG: agmatinase [Patescibacteria group bacterium]
MVASIINCANPEEADVVLIGVNYDVTSSFSKGADKGPWAIVDCLHTQIEFFERHTKTSPAENLKIAYHDIGDTNNLSPEEMVEYVRSIHEHYFSLGKFVIVLGGEHSVTNGPVQSLARQGLAESVTVVQIDAHFDLRDTDADFNDTPYGKYSHACVMRRTFENGFDTVHIGIRVYSQDEYDFARENNLKVFEWGKNRQPSFREIINSIKTDKVYLTLDVDGINPVYMPATGTPVQGGLDWEYLYGLLEELFKTKEVVGADIVEVAPRVGDTLTEYGAAQICYSLIAYKTRKNMKQEAVIDEPRPEGRESEAEFELSDSDNFSEELMAEENFYEEINQNELQGKPVIGHSVDKLDSLREIFENALPAFGGAYLRRVYTILREAVLNNVPLVVTVAGPITVSDQHRAWLIPLLETGWVAYLTVTDAICYHDGHDALYKAEAGNRSIKEVDIFGDDGAYREAGIIRVADTGFKEKVLFDQDRMISAILQRPEFQKRMTTTERNYLLGKYYEAQEKEVGVRSGLLSTCSRLGIPVFVGAPADGSAFLNSVKLWALNRVSNRPYWFDYDLHADVFESCAYHYWGLFNSESKALGVLILGGGVPKNYSLQPEPTLSQIFLLDGIRGYDYDVQIVSSPVTDGSLSSCFPSEAVSWGKINPETYRQQTESLQADYSMVMPFIVKALLDDPTLPKRNQLGLYYKRTELTDNLFDAVAENQSTIEETLSYPLKIISKS